MKSNFFKAAFVLSFLIMMAACSKDETNDEEPVQNETPEAVINGPAELTIPTMGGQILGMFDSKSSIGTITSQLWKLKSPDFELEQELDLGDENEVSHYFSRPGKYELELVTSNNGKYSIARKEINVIAPELPQDYKRPVVMMVREDAHKINNAIYLLHLETMEMVRLFGGITEEDNRINSDPTGQYLIFSLSVEPGHRKLFTYDLLTGLLTPVSTNNRNWAYSAAWSHDGNWIAYSDDSRPYENVIGSNSGIEEIALIKPDGSGQFYLHANKPETDYLGVSPSWSPDSKKVAVGSHFMLGLNNQLISIYENLFDGNPVKNGPVPTLEQLSRFFEAHSNGITREEFDKKITAGGKGLAWSPDSNLVAYTLSYSSPGYNTLYRFIVVSKVDGSGDIEVLAESGSNNSDESGLPQNPTWTLDGKTVYFAANRDLYKVNIDDKTPELVLDTDIFCGPSIYD